MFEINFPVTGQWTLKLGVPNRDFIRTAEGFKGTPQKQLRFLSVQADV